MTDQRDPDRARKDRDEPKRSPGAYIGNRPANAFETVAPPNRRDRTGQGPGNRPPGRFGGGGRPPSPSVAPRPDIAQPQPDLAIGRAVRDAEEDAASTSTSTNAARTRGGPNEDAGGPPTEASRDAASPDAGSRPSGGHGPTS